MDRKVFGQRLDELVKETGEIQTNVAIDMGIEQGSLSSYISGRHEPRASTLCVIADFFDVSVDYLLGRKEDRRC